MFSADTSNRVQRGLAKSRIALKPAAAYQRVTCLYVAESMSADGVPDVERGLRLCDLRIKDYEYILFLLLLFYYS
jgi:hypothetical protein